MIRSTSFCVARLISCLTGAALASASLALAEPQVPPVYQLLRSLGEPATGFYSSDLIQGSDGALYGAAAVGGKFGDGTVFKLNPDGSGFTVLLNEIGNYSGVGPNGVIQGTDGALYGTTRRDSTLGDGGYGNVFKLNTDGSGFVNIYQFDYATTGAYPTAGMIQGTDSALYGTTSTGGGAGYGTVFKLDLSDRSITVLVNFANSTTGAFPNAGLIQGTDGALYGTTTNGGSNQYGTLYKLNTDGSGVTVLLNFDDSTIGSNALVIERTDGTLYGTTANGGSNGYGTLFRLSTDGSGFTVLLNFDNFTTGSHPNARLVEGTDGSLYGTTTFGGVNGYGTLFKFDADGSGFTVLSNLDDSTTGSFPYAGLIEGTDGLLYGTTTSGGGNGRGTLFKVQADGSGFMDLHDLIGLTGSNPVAGLIQATDGALYGTTLSGGSGEALPWSNGAGTLFKLSLDGTRFADLFDFDASFIDSTSGVYPTADLIQASDGNLYGTNSDLGDGGWNGYGKVFGWDFSYGFHQVTGAVYPRAGVIQGMDGALYGTASGYGEYAFSPYGSVFKVDLDGYGWTLLMKFDKSTTGAYPYAGLIQGTDGTLYGTTSAGGSAGDGTVFKLNPDGTGVTVLLNFDDSTSGANPRARLIQGTDGALYGTASQGGSAGYGTVFTLNPDGTGFAVLRNFDGTTSGATPAAGLMRASDGVLYGTASQGGSYGFGTVFKLNTDGSGFTVLLNFDNATNGAYPAADLIQASDGNLYTTTSAGGAFGGGTVFRLTLSASWSNYGAGFAGTRGIPNFTSSANPVLGTTITFDIDNSLGSDAVGFLILGLSQTSIPFKQGTVLVNFFDNWTLVLPLLSMPATGQTIDVAIPDDDSFLGLELDAQVLELDPGAARGVSFTPGLNLMLGK